MNVVPSCTFISTKSTVTTIGVLSLVVTVTCSINLCIELYEVSMVVHKDLSQMGDVVLGIAALLHQTIILALLFLTFVDIVASVFMIVGTCKNKPGYIFPWLALRFGGILCAICMCIAVMIISAVSFSLGKFCLVSFVAGIACTLAVWFWLIVYGHYKDVIEESLEVEHPNDGKVLTAGPILYRNI